MPTKQWVHFLVSSLKWVLNMGQTLVKCPIVLDSLRWWHLSIFKHVSPFNRVQYTKYTKPKPSPLNITWNSDFVQVTIYWKKVGRRWHRKKSNPIGVWFLYLLTGELNSFLRIQTKYGNAIFMNMYHFCQPSARYCVIFLSHTERSTNGWKIWLGFSRFLLCNLPRVL